MSFSNRERYGAREDPEEEKMESFAQELRQLLISTSMVSNILSPFTQSHLLEMVVKTATQVINARSGSLFLIDEEAQELVFEVAIGPAAEAVKKFRVPLGHGIVGLVVTTGQPMAITNVKDDRNFASDIASSVKYIPESILCVPLFYDGTIIGALELLDKVDALSFGPNDIETLGLFSNIAAVAIAQSQAYKDQYAILDGLLRAFRETDAVYKERLYRDAHAFAAWMETGDSLPGRARQLAQLVNKLLLSGERESELCKNILECIATYSLNHKIMSFV